MNYDQLKQTANAMVVKGKGILAADESTPTCTKRFVNIGAESTEVNRNKYRDLLFTTSGIEAFISGIILYDETLRQSTISKGIPFAEYLRSINIIDPRSLILEIHPFNETRTPFSDAVISPHV